MLAEWQSFLLAHGARIEAEIVQDFGNPGQEATAALDGNALTDLSFLAVIKITGPDATGFLHSQFSSDIIKMVEGTVQLSAWCNPKGQVIGSFIISRLKDEFYLVLPEELKDTFIKRLRMYVLRAHVNIEDEQSLSCIGIKLSGSQPAGVAMLQQTTSPEKAVRLVNNVIIPIPVNRNRWLIVGPGEALGETWAELANACTPVGSHYWQLFDILDGLPWILTATSESFLPQMLNMDQLQAVSFNKGCFPGQEVIARLQHRGKVKQRLTIAILESGEDIGPGEKIYRDGETQSIGTVINIAEHPGEGLYALSVLDVEHGTTDQLRLKNDNIRFIRITAPSCLILP